MFSTDCVAIHVSVHTPICNYTYAVQGIGFFIWDMTVSVMVTDSRTLTAPRKHGFSCSILVGTQLLCSVDRNKKTDCAVSSCLSSGRPMMASFWRWTGIQSMTSSFQGEKIVNIRWAVSESYLLTFLDVVGVVQFPLNLSGPLTGMGQLRSSAVLFITSWLPSHLCVLVSRRRSVCCGLF